ncbi:SDR family NAD(P)-dependent oxidoreductase [Streptomyces sp. S465]|uniref:SDR family NAD(P)-dependent oxidoreductase n=1 Tax=Streptomyces sp. S465 TaxID=2979468 RepID=UPI0022A85A0E|nr:SDR family NAD(P)-dependent oxidoreductase [Streptomyces sp. S465]WAP54772.1 SDR family NAD(P)-dependent oxidoreductase [Streptomyces sp. S465]
MTGQDLSGHVAVVTGARRGIGAAIAAVLLDHGATVVTGGRDGALLARQAEELGERGRVIPCAADLRTATGRTRLLEAAGRVDILVNNAGGFTRASTTRDTTPGDWQQQLEINLTIPFLLCQSVLPGMIERGWGRILNIGSVVASAPQLGNAIGYVAAKSGLVGFTRQLAAEVAGLGVTANVLNPGTVKTEHLDEYFAASDTVSEQTLSAAIPVGRLGRPDEIAAIVPYLVSDASGFLTGSVIDINGGAIHA